MGCTAGFLLVSRRLDHRELVAVNAELRAEVRRLHRELGRLQVENEVLHEAAQPLIHQVAAHERFAFVHRLRNRFAVKRLCRILVIDRSNYYLWTRAQARRDERARDEQALAVLTVEIHTAHPAYGAERITRELKRQAFRSADAGWRGLCGSRGSPGSPGAGGGT